MSSKIGRSAVDRARAARAKRIKSLRKRERLRPALEMLDRVIDRLRAEDQQEPEREALSYLTSVLRDSYSAVLEQIKASGKTGIAAQNAIKRSAGTNFQGMCEYALIRWLDSTNLPVHIGTNAPKSMKEELTILGVDAGSEFSVEPDIDICLWLEDEEETSPVVFVSAKSSLVDRAGQAARWKLYLDLHQTTCPYTEEVTDCPIHKTRVRMKTSRPIEHTIVTANIYKIDTTQPEGELSSGQCRNNTYMFQHRYTTRNDPAEVRPEPWRSFSEFPLLVEKIFRDKALD